MGILELEKKISEFRKWYQTIDFGNGIVTPGKGNGEEVWKKIRSYLPKELSGYRFLDVGCNAGLLCVRSALEGANVVGVELSPYWFDQALFVKKNFEEIYNKKLNIEYIKDDIFGVMGKKGFFDYVFVISFIYHLKENKQVEFIQNLSNITSKVIVRYKLEERIKEIRKIDCIFTDNGFDIEKEISEKKLGKYLVFYGKNNVS